MNVRPPGRVSLLWCPACGRTDVTTAEGLSKANVHVGELGGTCLGDRQLLEYVLPAPTHPLPGTEDGTYRAAVAVEVAIRPAPPHLRDGTYRVAFVGQTTLIHADAVEQLALLVEASADLITRQVGDRIAVHPRPAPPMGWPT